MRAYAKADQPAIAPRAEQWRQFEANMPIGLKFMIADRNAARAAVVEAGLSGFVGARIARVATLSDSNAQLDRLAADVFIVSCDSPDRGMLADLREICAQHPRPVIMFAETSDSSLTEGVLCAGVSTYIVDGLSERRIKAVVDVALVRFGMLQNLRGELEKAKSDLAARKIIERAKGVLIERNRLSEADAYNALRRSAMEEGKTILEIANAIIAVTRLLKV